MHIPNSPDVKPLQCAIYCRAGNENGPARLEQQRHSCEAFIKDQDGLGLVAVETRYDDLDVSARTLDRPALQRLLTDVREGRIQAVVVHDLARLARSPAILIDVVNLFDAHNVDLLPVDILRTSGKPVSSSDFLTLQRLAVSQHVLTSARASDKLAVTSEKRQGQGNG